MMVEDKRQIIILNCMIINCALFPLPRNMTYWRMWIFRYGAWGLEDMLDRGLANTGRVVEAGASGAIGDVRIPGQPRLSMPTWLKNDCLRVHNRLIEEMRHDSSRMPTCYDRYTFYDGTDNCFLAARASYNGFAAGIFHQPQYFVWLLRWTVYHVQCARRLSGKVQRNL
ncbi:uncharacterized protein EDB91DRAFT_179595 [Suillus paluster]|uniref:uncharacterized protein n=1 Tax=Suillus paluster TaxID=48578 RepID=UPI001B8860E9|nr:uncharacterized protein EDB91DRAFT_179595 [Suillus paluster]KAG1723362.1 hypothetical protein EDB91DRAFT_179595 [Suillus paluster]